MRNMIFEWLLLCVLFVTHLDCEVYLDRPKIKTSDGDLIIEPALDKNIYLRPNGPKSGIFIGNVDIVKTIVAFPTDATLYQPGSSENIDKYLTGPNGILQRLEKLENKEAVTPDTLLLNITLLWRRVNNLNRKIVALQNQVNNRQRDECSSHPCQHGGTCLNLVGGYHCLCPDNWEGRDCDVDVNECRNFAGTDLGCQNGATCLNRPGSYECLCKTGWFGLHCTRKAKDCSGGDFEMCGFGSCIPVTSGEGIKCICHQGWTSNATSTACLTDINECEAYQGPRCSVNPKVECVNTPGSFRCGQCPPGYEGDGYACNDIDECTLLPNGGCSPMSTCHNTIGSRICGPCPPGYQGDGVTCVFRGSCSINHGGCHPSAQCVETLSPTGQVSQCICPEGMEGDGIGFFGCFMSSSNSSDGCESRPCGAHGQCHSLRTGYTCICNKGYSGARCNMQTDSCAINPCQNNGICRKDDTVISGFRCECTAQYSGSLCQVRSKSCGGILDAEEGSIAYPLSNTSLTYNHNAQCAWVIHTVPDKVINITFSKFNVELTPECSSDFLQIHDGRKSSSQLVGRFCGNTLPKGGNIISSHNNLYFWFHSDRTVAKAGFALHWTSIDPVCGGEIDATTHGHISSPGSPGPYPPNRDCYWHLATTPGKRISLHFFALDIEAHNNCSFDYLAVYDGEHVTDTILDKYCNSTQPAPLISANSEILIHFHSDAYGTGNGFQITYAPVEGVPGCGGYFTADKGEIVSPSYNNLYQSNLLCEYKIKTSAETKIKIEFKSFNIENSFRCRYDYLKVYDGATSDAQLVGKFCGNTYPATYTSTSNTLLIKFKSDRSVGAEGFRITYEAICEKYFVGDSGIIKSPSYPFSYPENKVCVYIIRTEPGKAIQLTFQDFDIEDNRYYSCRYDNIEIRNGPDRNSSLLGTYCGGSDHTPPVQISTYNYMYLRFKSDMTLSGTGFYANYTVIDTECGGIHREKTGLINHPAGDASTYRNDQNCQWLLLAPEGMHIKLTWNRFDIEDMPGCRSDYLEITEINDNNEQETLGRYCGTHSPPALTTSTNRLNLKFVSDSDIHHSGFSVSYTFLDEKTHCGGNFIKSHGIIHSPGWPQSYEPNRDCTWVITVPVGQQISLNISNFDLERPIRDKCNLGDYLEVRNGVSETSPLVGQYCGKIKYKRIISLANVLHLHFHSDFYLTGTGFNIEWDGTITGCGGTLTSSTGSITSPNYPNDYHDNAECFYRIVTSAGSRIRISFAELDLERTPNCRDDYVEIFDGRDANAASLGRYCLLSTKLANIETTANYAFIKFRSDLYVGGKGFLLNYNTICNNNLTGSYGVIESPNYPNNYPTLNCLWNIQVPKGNKINITFTHFDIFRYLRLRGWMRHNLVPVNDGECFSDYLQMKENSESNFGKKLCGTSLPMSISTKSNSFQVKFSSGVYGSRTGFRLEWVRYGCGGHIQKSYGTISLDKGETSDSEMECEWLIEVPAGKGINIVFSDIYVSDSKNCTIDAIEIYNGQNTKAPLLTKFCHERHASIESESNFMLIRFLKQSSMKNVYFTAQFHVSRLKCGGIMNTMSGFIYSKNYPRNYDNNQDCIWYITVPSNHRIEIDLIDLDLYSENDISTDTACGDAIFVYDTNDFQPSSNYTHRICPNSNKTQIVTKYSNIVVQFKTDGYGTAKGFKAYYSIACGAVISATRDGIITNNKFVNHSNKTCIWTIIAPSPDEKISLTITHISLSKDNSAISNRNCPSDFLRVYDGNDVNAPLIDEFCGKKVPPMIVSHGNVLTVELGSYTGTMTGVFSAHYSPITNACGGTLIAEEGTIASPSYPSPYPADVDCEWIISSSSGNSISIAFERFDLEFTEECNEDYLEIRENDGAGKLIGVFCGTNILNNSTSAAKLYIKFHSNSKTSGQGFLMHYSYVHENDIQGDNGEIASPLYPLHYGGAGEYTWRIYTTNINHISLTIDHLEISSYGDISYNKLIIYDGYDNTAPILEQIQGVLGQRKIIQASSNIVYITLTMDGTNTGSKFHLYWTSSSVEGQTEPGSRVNCGSNQTDIILSGQVRVLKSPNYPEQYDNDLNCEWVYKTVMGRHLNIHFVDLHIEEINACFADSISIYSAISPDNWKPIKESICTSNELKGDMNSSTYMKVVFKTDSSVTKKGFYAHVSSKCGGLITDLSGEVGPTWEDSYMNFAQNKVKCEWTVKVRPGRTIQLRFTHFNITTNNKDCFTNAVLRNGDSIDAPLLASGKYCGYEHEIKGDINTSSNSLFISYTNERRSPLAFQNFKIYYEEKNIECGSSSKLTSDHNWETISSPNYPSVPVPYSECVWTFTGPPGEILRIDFINRFDLDYTYDCGTEVVEVRDGASSLSPLKGRFCGETPATIKSSDNTLYIKYSTQLQEPRNGFNANISIDICGGTIVTDSGEVTSPGYPILQVLPTGTVCEWHIIGPPRHVFLIKPHDIQLPQTQSNCATKIDIEEFIPVNNTIAILKTMCNDDIENDYAAIETSSNNFTVKLTYGKRDEWDSTSDKRGFRIQFNSSRPMCGGKMTTSQGYLLSPTYPQETTLRYCQWVIEVPDKSRRIRLELIDMNEEKHKISIFNDLTFRTLIQNIPSDNSSLDDRVFESVSNKLTVYVWLNRLASSHRFKAKFSSDEQALCGGDLVGLNQELVAPDLERSYSCDWHYNNQIETVVQNNLTYNSIVITGVMNSSVTRTRCRFLDPQLIIKAPVSNKGITLRREICGNSDVSLRIPSSILDINAIKTKSKSFYFNLKIKSQPCGGIVHVGENAVDILNVPDFYNDTLDCAWIVVVPFSTRVEIKLTGSFVLGCDNEYLKIMKGLNQNNPELGNYCKDKSMETPLVARFSYMYIEYHTNVKNNTNIKLTARTVSNLCGGLLTSYQNSFSSPNYPKMYSPNQECTWELQADLGFRVSLQFVDRFVIEQKPNCTKDVIIIYDWKDDDYYETARICGRVPPPAYNSTFNRLKVVFRTDAETNLDGFKAQWSSICGGKYKATHKEQILYSPGFDYAYHPYMQCSYEIFTPDNQKVLLKFLEFELEGNYPECESDNLTVTASSDYNYLSRVFCGSQTPEPIRNFDKLTLEFKTDRYVQRRGFKLSYSIFKCGGKINNTDIITSTFGADNYDENMNCTWLIEAPYNKIVVVKFLYIDLESHIECYNDYVALYDGSYVTSDKRLAQLCGYMNSTTVMRSTGNKMTLEFITDSSLNYKGFKAVVYFSYSASAGCGGTINLTDSSSYVLKSPLMSRSVVYENFLDCQWSVVSPTNTVIKITFTKFHISPCQNVNQTAVGYSKCDCDLVEIKDGLNPNSLVIGTYCGHTFPPQQITSSNMMAVRLSTDGELVSSGFEATLSVQQTVCGLSNIRVSFNPIRFKSPGYDTGSVPRGLHCVYRLDAMAEPYNQIRITVIHLQLQQSIGETPDGYHCNKDRLIISSTPNQSNTTGRNIIVNHQSDDFFTHNYFYESTVHFPSHFELCGNKETTDYYVFGSASINLITSPDTDGANQKGVEIEVAFVGFCGRNYTEPQGRVINYYYVGSNSIVSEDDCYTLITAPENYTISAYFINVVPDYWDENTYLEIFDGQKTTARQLVKIHNQYENNYPVFSTGRYMLLHNHQNNQNRLTYDMNYVTTDKGIGCGGKLNNIVGTVTSPLYPNSYRHKNICYWELETPLNTRLLLRFNTFDLGVTCDQNYLQLVDSKGIVVRTFCSETPADYMSNDNYIKLVFYTTMNNSGRGWSAAFVGTKV